MICFGLMVGACSTQHTGYKNEKKTPEDLFQRRIESEIKDAFYRQPPNCVTVLPSRTRAVRSLATRSLENAIARHARDRFDRVIGHAEREHLVRRLGLILIILLIVRGTPIKVSAAISSNSFLGVVGRHIW